jgi:hypothetical protein
MVTIASTRPTMAGTLERIPSSFKLGSHPGSQWERAKASHHTPQAKLAQTIAPIQVRCRRLMCRLLG